MSTLDIEQHLQQMQWNPQALTAASDAEDSSSETDKAEGPSVRRHAGQGVMSKSHQTGLAKLPYGMEWLMNALGGAQKAPQEAASQQDVGAETAPKFLIFAHHKYASHARQLCHVIVLLTAAQNTRTACPSGSASSL